MKTFNTPASKNFEKKTTFAIHSESIKSRLQQCIDEGMSKYEIAMTLPETLKMKEGISENLTRHYIRKHFEEQE